MGRSVKIGTFFLTFISTGPHFAKCKAELRNQGQCTRFFTQLLGEMTTDELCSLFLPFTSQIRMLAAKLSKLYLKSLAYSVSWCWCTQLLNAIWKDCI